MICRSASKSQAWQQSHSSRADRAFSGDATRGARITKAVADPTDRS
jgi:hypothetical protein